jgi:hypothetical protein
VHYLQLHLPCMHEHEKAQLIDDQNISSVVVEIELGPVSADASSLVLQVIMLLFFCL